MRNVLDPFSNTAFAERQSVPRSVICSRSPSEYNLHYSDRHGRRIAVLLMMNFQYRQNAGASTVKNHMSDIIVSTGLLLYILHHTAQPISLLCPLPTTRVT